MSWMNTVVCLNLEKSVELFKMTLRFLKSGVGGRDLIFISNISLILAKKRVLDYIGLRLRFPISALWRMWRGVGAMSAAWQCFSLRPENDVPAFRHSSLRN